MRSKKQRYWTPRNAVLLPTFLIEAEITDGGSDVGELLKIFARSVTEREEEGEEEFGDDDDDDENSSKEGEEAEESKKKKMKKTRPPSRRWPPF